MFERQNDTKALKAELTEYIFGLFNYNLEQIHLLKKISSEDEWKSDLQKILGLKSHPYIRYELMASEGMFRELLNELETDPYLTALQQYEEV